VTLKTYALRMGVNTVGRAAINDVRIDETSVSGRHCEVVIGEEACTVRDLGSTNGTYVDGQRVTEASLGWGQTLRLGAVELGVQDLPARVSIPEGALLKPEAPPVEVMEDGRTPCCRAHPEVVAAFRCLKCGAKWCGPCVRHLRRVGGQVMHFCTGCGGPCEPLDPTETIRRPGARALYWLDRVADNFRSRPKYAGRSRRKS
jgi:pSer/pThr/pTyr-binding forkhead associated (FHA) protein